MAWWLEEHVGYMWSRESIQIAVASLLTAGGG